MLCSECQTREAHVFLKQIVNSQVAQRALCGECAERLAGPLGAAPAALLLQALAGLESMLGAPAAEPRGAAAEPRHAPQCPSCGLKYSQFQEGGRLACADCYESFRPQLTDLLRRVHGSDQHRGKLPKGSRGTLERVSRHDDLKRLQRQLKAAIDGERFEEAASLRDQIQRLQ